MNITQLPKIAQEFMSLFDDVIFIPFNVSFLSMTGMKHLKEDNIGLSMVCTQYSIVTKEHIINIPMNCAEDDEVLSRGMTIAEFINKKKIDDIICLLRKEVYFDENGVLLNRVTIIELDDLNIKYYVDNIQRYVTCDKLRSDNHETAIEQYGNDATSIADLIEEQFDLGY